MVPPGVALARRVLPVGGAKQHPGARPGATRPAVLGPAPPANSLCSGGPLACGAALRGGFKTVNRAVFEGRGEWHRAVWRRRGRRRARAGPANSSRSSRSRSASVGRCPARPSSSRRRSASCPGRCHAPSRRCPWRSQQRPVAHRQHQRDHPGHRVGRVRHHRQHPPGLARLRRDARQRLQQPLQASLVVLVGRTRLHD